MYKKVDKREKRKKERIQAREREERRNMEKVDGDESRNEGPRVSYYFRFAYVSCFSGRHTGKGVFIVAENGGEGTA